ncbi:MAG: cytochrome C oxidase subunit IV family protein [Candidatus Neomarinimicrobiota bacterium]
MSSDHDIIDIQRHIKVYMTIFAALAVLTIITVAASYLDLSTGEAILLALTIASVKGSLVAGYFMHLISEKALITWILMLTAGFFFVLMFIPMASFIDQAQLG